MDKTEELVLKVQRGDKDAFEALFNLYKTKAMRLAYLITNNQTLSRVTFIVIVVLVSLGTGYPFPKEKSDGKIILSIAPFLL